MIEFLLQLIYPNVCGFCKQLDKEGLCKKCELKLKELDRTRIDNYKNKYFNRHAYIFKYDGEIRKLMLDYKFNDNAYLYKTFAKIILNNKKICDFIKLYDLIIPIPLHKKRLNSRGYNQSELIIKEACRNIKNLTLENKVLIKTGKNLPQSTLNKRERINNVKNVYNIKNNKIIKNKKILLFDDIYTTGSTANECARILIDNEAKEVGIFTIAKD